MKNLIVFLGLLAVTIGAQTIATRPTLSSADHRILVLTPQGPVGATLGAGLTLTATPGGITISAQQQAASPLTHRFLTIDATTRNISAPACPVIFRNGIALLEGPAADYTRITGGVRVNATIALDPMDQWSGLCN